MTPTASEQTAEAKAIAEATPMVRTGLARLREPFPAEHVGKLPKAGVTLDYVGHGAVTDRLLEVDPMWTWEPLAFTDDGMPRFVLDANNKPTALWIRLTVLGVTRLGVGTCSPGQFDAEKVLIGDALRNAAMRFGVALDLWIRGQAEDDEKHVATREPTKHERPRCPACGEFLTGKAVKSTDGAFVHEACA